MATLEERLAALKTASSTDVEEDSLAKKAVDEVSKGFGSLNVGIANMLGGPVELASGVMKALHIIPNETKPFAGTESVRKFFSDVGMAPEMGKEDKSLTGRGLRIAGETIIPFMGMRSVGSKIAAKTPIVMNDMQKALMAMYQKPWATAGAETASVLGATYAGDFAARAYPEYRVAEAMAELLGGVSPTAVTGLLRATTNLPGPKAIKGIVTGRGAQVRAARRVQAMAGDLDAARINAMSSSELHLDPITATGDAGLIALEKAALDQDPQLADRVAKLTLRAMETARKKVLSTGDPQATIDYLKALRRNAAANAQSSISKMGTDIDPVTASRAVRGSIEKSLSKARAAESKLWEALPTKGDIDSTNILTHFEDILRDRSIAADPEEIPGFLYDLIGRVTKKGFKAGKLAKDSQLGTVKDLRSRLQREMTVERAKDAPNRNKLRLLGQLEDTIFDSIADFSPEYSEAVGFSRELNKSFTSGKVGDLLGYERTGELSTSAEGTLDFLMSGNKDEVRMGIRQIASASPEAVPLIKENIRATFNAQAIDPDSGALNVNHARRFLKNNGHVLDEFPEIKAQVEASIKNQRVVDELAGANVGDKMSTYIKDKSVTALYLEDTPDNAMHKLVTSKNEKGVGSIMQQMIDITNTDPSGRATKGLKSAFGGYLLKHSETSDVNILSGKKFTRMLKHLDAAAKKLYTKDELKRLHRIGAELTKIEVRQSAKSARGGVIADAPNKIIHLIGGTMAARAGSKAGAGTSGASLRTASIFTKEYNALLGRLTNDGAEQAIMRAVEDPAVLKDLLLEATPANIKRVTKTLSAFLTGQAISQQGGGGEPVGTVEERMELLKQSLSARGVSEQ